MCVEGKEMIGNRVYIRMVRYPYFMEFEVIPIYSDTPLKTYRYRECAVKFCEKNGLEIVESRNE